MLPAVTESERTMAIDQKLRVGFVGTGWTERVQIPAFRAGGLEASAICSGSLANAQRVAKKLDIPEVHQSWEELIASPSVDIVCIATPPHLHCDIAVKALQAGKHVICEKPTALNLRQAETMFAAAQAAPEQLAIIDHELRFNPARLQMRQMIKDGFVGTVLRIHLDRLGSERLNPQQGWSWWSDAEYGGGMLGAVGSHLLDLARWMIGRIDSLVGQLQIGHYFRTDAATGVERQVTADDHAQILLRFANGAQGDITVSGITPGGYGMSVLVTGSEGALRLDAQDQLWGQRHNASSGKEWEAIRPKYPPMDLSALPNNSPFTVGSFHLAQTLAASLASGETVVADAASFYDGLVVQRMLDAVRESHRRSAWVQL